MQVGDHFMQLLTYLSAVKTLREGVDSLGSIEEHPEPTVVCLSLLGLHEDACRRKCPVGN